MDVDSAREDTRDVLEVSGEIQEKPSGRQGERDWHYDEERYEDADHFSAVERRELYNYTHNSSSTENNTFKLLSGLKLQVYCLTENKCITLLVETIGA